MVLPRRHALLTFGAIFALAFAPLVGCNMSTKKHIRSFGKTFRYLKDPALREKETGSTTLVVEGAEFSGERFEGVEWRNIIFKNCDFVGAYEVKPQSSTRVRYEDCRFSGIFGYGKANDLHFLRCAWTSGSNAYAAEGSRQVLFEACRFVGTDPDVNHWGAVGSDGEAEFVGCSAQRFNLDGHAKLTLRDCELQNVKCAPSARESGGVYAQVLIEKCKLRGTLDMVSASLQSLTIRDTQIDILDMNNATLKGDILMERVRGNSIRAGVVSVRNLTLRDCQLNNDGNTAFMTAVQGSEQLLIDNCTISGGMLKGVSLGAGRPLEANEWSATPKNKNTTIRTSKLSYLDATWCETQHLRFDNTQIERADISHGRIGTLELNDATFGFTLDLSQTQIKEFKQNGGTALRRLGGLKTDGSNIRLPR